MYLAKRQLRQQSDSKYSNCSDADTGADTNAQQSATYPRANTP